MLIVFHGKGKKDNILPKQIYVVYYSKLVLGSFFAEIVCSCFERFFLIIRSFLRSFASVSQ